MNSLQILFQFILLLFFSILVFFCNRHYSLLSFWLPQHILILHINFEVLPITYSVSCVSTISWQTLQPIKLCYFILGEWLSFTWTAANWFNRGTRGKLYHTQTPTLTTRLSRPSLLFYHKFTKIRIKSFEGPISKPATQYFISNLSK